LESEVHIDEKREKKAAQRKLLKEGLDRQVKAGRLRHKAEREMELASDKERIRFMEKQNDRAKRGGEARRALQDHEREIMVSRLAEIAARKQMIREKELLADKRLMRDAVKDAYDRDAHKRDKAEVHKREAVVAREEYVEARREEQRRKEEERGMCVLCAVRCVLCAVCCVLCGTAC
jgi:hypothetical protein